MQSQGHRPDVGVFNTLIEVLSRSGSCPAFLKAIQLFSSASRQGQFRYDLPHDFERVKGSVATHSICLIKVGTSMFLSSIQRFRQWLVLLSCLLSNEVTSTLIHSESSKYMSTASYILGAASRRPCSLSCSQKLKVFDHPKQFKSDRVRLCLQDVPAEPVRDVHHCFHGGCRCLGHAPLAPRPAQQA